jgi:ribosome-associated heat shock protein Hsp15
MESATEVRIDKWLWAVRIFKTRSLATEACRGGHVKLDGKNVKPSRNVKPGEIVTAQTGQITRTLKVIAPLEQRVGPKVVAQYAEDLTSPEELAKRNEPTTQPLFFRPKGAGRPTKKDRRLMESMGPDPLAFE